MITLYDKGFTGYQFIADTEDDITTAETQTKAILGSVPEPHSAILVIATKNVYFRDSQGNWNKLGGST